MKTIMVATDFSRRSDRALSRAAVLARQFGASIILIHVVNDDQPRRIVEIEHEESAVLLAQSAETFKEVDGVACEVRIVRASSFVGIIQAAEELRPDLLVIGSHRRHVLKDVFIGTTAERTIRLVDCPVLMVNAQPAGQYRHIMHTTDLSAGSRDALQRARDLRIGDDAINTLLYVFDAPALRLVMVDTMTKNDQALYLASEQMNAMRDLDAFTSSAKLDDFAPQVRHKPKATHHEILTAAEEENADLIVVSTHGRTGLAKLLIGSVTERVLRSASIDVLAIPPRRDA